MTPCERAHHGLNPVSVSPLLGGVCYALCVMHCEWQSCSVVSLVCVNSAAICRKACTFWQATRCACKQKGSGVEWSKKNVIYAEFSDITAASATEDVLCLCIFSLFGATYSLVCSTKWCISYSPRDLCVRVQVSIAFFCPSPICCSIYQFSCLLNHSVCVS